MKTLKEEQEEWFEINAPLGRELGYPECCIREFCDQPPALLKNREATNDDMMRYMAGCIRGKFTGFAPCLFHAKEILAFKIRIEWLIKNRSSKFPPFPHYGTDLFK